MNPQAPVQTPAEPLSEGWHAKFRTLLFIVFAFEIGFFLLVFPWMGIWDKTSIPVVLPWLSSIWDNPYFRGAVSGLGLVNIYISLLEVSRLRKH